MHGIVVFAIEAMIVKRAIYMALFITKPQFKVSMCCCCEEERKWVTLISERLRLIEVDMEYGHF